MSRKVQPFSRNSDSDMEVVEDSEPERLQLRNQSRKSESNVGLPQRTTSASGVHQHRLNNVGLHTSATVIEISDSESTSSCSEDAITYRSAPKPVKDPLQESSKPIIDFKKFAFKPLPTKEQTPSVEPFIPQQPRKAPSPERHRGPGKAYTNLDYLLSDVARVSQCVCCSISWTTRKTAAQKMDHIQRCAKKNGFDNETVGILIKNKITASTGFTVGLSKAPMTQSTSTTLLEDVVQDRSNRRKKVHPCSHLSVASPSREGILSRAKDIIARPSPDEASPQLSSRKLASDLRPTQTFTTSTLLQGPSKTSLFSATSEVDEYFPGPRDGTLDTLPSANQIGIGKLPNRSPDIVDDGLGQDNYRKGVNQMNVPSDRLQVTPHTVLIQKVKEGKSSSSEKSIHTGIGTSLNECVSPAKLILPKVRSSIKKKAVFGKEWEAFMKERIREDNELNLRVIRYEPVDFNLFLKFAKAYAPSASETTLKPHLRNFLDNQAIHFYEGNVWKR